MDSLTEHDVSAFRRCADALIEVGHVLYERGWSPATSSNYSMRMPGGLCAITRSGAHKGQLTSDDIAVVDADGHPLLPRKPSAETALHVQLYRWQERIGSVLHVHSINATVLSRVLPDDRLTLTGYELLKALAGIDSHAAKVTIPIFANTQDIASLACQVDEYLHRYPTCPGYLIRGHGVYTWGQTMIDTMRHLEALDFLFQCRLSEGTYERIKSL